MNLDSGALSFLKLHQAPVGACEDKDVVSEVGDLVSAKSHFRDGTSVGQTGQEEDLIYSPGYGWFSKDSGVLPRPLRNSINWAVCE